MNISDKKIVDDYPDIAVTILDTQRLIPLRELLEEAYIRDATHVSVTDHGITIVGRSYSFFWCGGELTKIRATGISGHQTLLILMRFCDKQIDEQLRYA